MTTVLVMVHNHQLGGVNGSLIAAESAVSITVTGSVTAQHYLLNWLLEVCLIGITQMLLPFHCTAEMCRSLMKSAAFLDWNYK